MSFFFVPIPEHLRREELAVQLEERLKLIQIYHESVFDRINTTLSTFNSKLNNINERSSVCMSKISNLKEKRKAIAIYSHPKFPLVEQNAQFKSAIFQNDALQKDVLNRIEQNKLNEKKLINSTHIPFDDEGTKNKSLFFIFDRIHYKKVIPDHLTENSFPLELITSISSLIRFNSSHNCYALQSQGYRQNVVKNQPSKKNNQNDDDEVNPSLSLMNEPTLQLEDEGNFNLTFTNAPELFDDLPTELPSLFGIADEFNFNDPKSSDDNLFGANGNKLSLPDLALVSSHSKKLPSSVDTVPSRPNDLVKPNATLSQTEAPSSHITPLVSLPPPPPPPPPPFQPEQPSQKGQTVPKTLASTDSNRASLLESIRAAAGKPKAKTIKEQKLDEKLKKKEVGEATVESKTAEDPNKPMDMMDELRKRLDSRRSAFSNESSKKKFSNHSSVVANMSALIPPPLPTQDTDSDGSDSESENEFVDEWE